jgi:hydroxylamine reductase (hybrid-cluster protein)
MLQVSIITTKSIIVAIVGSKDANIDQYVCANLASTIANAFVAADVVVGATDQGAAVMVAVVITVAAVRTTEADRMKDPTVTADLDLMNADTATNLDRTNAATILVVITIDHLVPMNAAITTTIVAARPKADLVRMKTFIVVKETDPVRSDPIIRRSYRSSSWATAQDNPFSKMST